MAALKDAESQLKQAKAKNAKTKTVTQIQKQTIMQTVTASAAAAAVRNQTVTYVFRSSRPGCGHDLARLEFDGGCGRYES